MLSQNGLDSQYLYDLLKRLCKYYKYKAAHSFHLSCNGYSTYWKGGIVLHYCSDFQHVILAFAIPKEFLYSNIGRMFYIFSQLS